MNIPNNIKKNNKINKNYSYEKGECKLNFSLRIDIKNELKDFLELLKVAVKDIEEDLVIKK